MKPTEMPAWKLTADCIWNSFRSSGKKHLLVTGSLGSGKTTLMAKLTDKNMPGITTWAVPNEAVYLKENTTGRTVRIGLYDLLHPGNSRKMQPVFYGFAALGIPALQCCIEAPGEWVTLDEIGYLELRCPEYCQELLRLMEKKRVIASVRKDDLPFLRTLLNRSDVFDLDLDQPFGDAGCVIMASGEGKRFGGDKLMADFHGKPMVQWILDATDGLFSRRVVVTRNPEVEKLCREHEIPVVLHQFPLRSDTVRLGLEAVGNPKHCMFCPADQPMLRAETIMSLLMNAVNDSDAIWRPRCGEQAGAPILFPQWAYEELAALPAGKGGGFTAAQHGEQVRYLDIADAWELFDIDTQEDLEKAKALPVSADSQ